MDFCWLLLNTIISGSKCNILKVKEGRSRAFSLIGVFMRETEWMGSPPLTAWHDAPMQGASWQSLIAARNKPGSSLLCPQFPAESIPSRRTRQRKRDWKIQVTEQKCSSDSSLCVLHQIFFTEMIWTVLKCLAIKHKMYFQIYTQTEQEAVLQILPAVNLQTSLISLSGRWVVGRRRGTNEGPCTVLLWLVTKSLWSNMSVLHLESGRSNDLTNVNVKMSTLKPPEGKRSLHIQKFLSRAERVVHNHKIRHWMGTDKK